MKIASISTTKNECDVIEAFVRHNARFCDKFFFIDESVDQTRTILKALQEEGFDITIFGSTSAVYEQRALITSVLRHIHSLDEIDWVVLLDADEILPDVPRSEFEYWLGVVQPNTLAAMAWQTYVPINQDFYEVNDPLVECFLPRNSEGPQPPIFKICVPKLLFGSASIDPGNHGARDVVSSVQIPTVMLPLRLGHFPVRTVEQITVKNIVAAHVTSMKEGKTAIEGWHVYQSLEQMRTNDFSVSYADLLTVALNYAVADTQIRLEVDQNAKPIRAEPAVMKFKNLRYRSPIAALDRELETMAKLVLSYRKAVSGSKRAMLEAQSKSNEVLALLQAADSKAS